MKNDQDIMNNYNKNVQNEQVLCTNEYGFITEQFKSSIQISTQSLKSKWYEIIEKYQNDYKKYRQSKNVYKIIRYGIPISLKYTLWKIFTNKSFNHDFESLKNIPSEYSHQIHVDVQRTFRTHFLFFKPYGRGQSELFNILVAFSNFKPNIGYCQGMSNFAAILLMYFPEEEAFEMMVNVIQKNKLEDLFDKSLSKISRIQPLQIELFKLIIPDVLNHLLENSIDISVYAISWYLTLFTRFEIKYVLRFWDLFLYLDFSIFLFISTSIIKFFRDIILELKNEQLVEFMGKIDTFEMNIDLIINDALKYAQKYNYLLLKKKLN